MSSFDISEFEKFVNDWKKLEKEFNTFLKKFLLQQAQRVIEKAKENTPEVTGMLRAMWGVGNQKLVVASNIATRKIELVRGKGGTTNKSVKDIVVNGNNFEITIWNGMEYASFVEYGHRIPNGKWKDGRFMLTIAMDEVQKQMPQRFSKAWENFLAKHGVK